jgi:glutamine synthetase
MPPAKKEARPSTRTGRARTPAYVKNRRGVRNWKEVGDWLEWRGIEDIECITPDQAGVARGKMMPSKKFTSNTSLALPSAVFMATISGGYPENGNGFAYPEDDGDLKLVPDLSTLTVVPWEEDPTAQVICDLVHQDGRFVEFTPRNVLKRIVSLYAEHGLRPVVAPEIEFYLVRKNPDPDYPLTPPVGRSGRAIGGGAGYSIAGVNEFDELIDDIYHFSENQGLEIDTLIHEEGAGQLEINLRHGDPVELADQVFMFKRTIREAALKHDTYATFMAKPIQGQPGSAMHIHQSIVNNKTGSNIFKADDGTETDAFFHFIGGMQKHVPNALVMFAPYVNSYRRLTQSASAPVNAKWGYDNRTTAFRVPRSDPAARRVENRIPSSDANPYLALAASLACGLIGLRNKIKPDAPVVTSANEDEIDLPRGLLEAVDLFEADDELRAMLGSSFVATYAAIKRAEFETFMEVISPWEREFLLLNV